MQKEGTAIQSIKSWIFPSLVSLLSVMIWNDVNEIKADVKMLMAQSNIDKTRIDNLERQVYKTASIPVPPKTELPLFMKVIALRPEDQEMVFQIKPHSI